MSNTYVQKGSDVKKDILSIYGITNKHIPDIQLELKELFKRNWAEQQGDQEYIPVTAMFKAYEQDLEFVCLNVSAPIDAAKIIKPFLAYLQGSEFSFYSEYHKRGFRCRYVKYDSKAFYREAEEVVVFNVTVKINNALSYAYLSIPAIIYMPQTTGAVRNWWGISVNSSNGDVCTIIQDSGAYKRELGVGLFHELNTTLTAIQGISVNSITGDIYICVSNGDIYKQTAGAGEFIAQNATGATKAWNGISVNSSNGDVYACVNNGDIYKQDSGAGNWVAQNATGEARAWWSIYVATNGDVYAYVWLGGLYKQTAGVGDFVAQDITGIAAGFITFSVNPTTGDVYICVSGGDIYKQAGGVGAWVAQNATGGVRAWHGISVSTNGDVYAIEFGGDIYKQTGASGGAGSGEFVAQNATIAIISHVFAVSFTADCDMTIYWDDGTTNTYASGASISKTFSEDGHFGIIVPTKLV